MEMCLGHRFQPYDHELIRFLYHFVTGRSLHDQSRILHEDLFGDKEPWELLRTRNDVQYFFTELKRKTANGSRFERTVGRRVNGKKHGNWHGQDKGKPVFNQSGKAVVGYKRSFVYKTKRPEGNGVDGQWLLKEFYLSDAVIQKSKEIYPILEERKDFVLCRLKRKNTADQDKRINSSHNLSVPIETVLQILEGANEEHTTSKILSSEPTSLQPPMQGEDACDINNVPEPVSIQPPMQEPVDQIGMNLDVPLGIVPPESVSSQPPTTQDGIISSYFDGIPVENIMVESVFSQSSTPENEGANNVCFYGIPAENIVTEQVSFQPPLQEPVNQLIGMYFDGPVGIVPPESVSSQPPTQDGIISSYFDGIPAENTVPEPAPFQAPMQEKDDGISLEELMEDGNQLGEYLDTFLSTFSADASANL